MKSTVETLRIVFLVLFSKEFRDLVKYFIKLYRNSAVFGCCQKLLEHEDKVPLVNSLIDDDSFHRLCEAIINQLNISKKDETLLSSSSSEN